MFTLWGLCRLLVCPPLICQRARGVGDGRTTSIVSERMVGSVVWIGVLLSQQSASLSFDPMTMPIDLVGSNAP